MKEIKRLMNCPACHKELEVESVREHRHGRVRIYWECNGCDFSIMHRGKKDFDGT